MAAIDEKEYTQSFDWRIWKRLGPFLRPYRGAFISMLVFNGICALVDVVLPLFQKYAIQNFIEKDTLTGLLPYALAYLAVVVVQALWWLWNMHGYPAWDGNVLSADPCDTNLGTCGQFAAMLALNWKLALAVIAIVPVMAILTGYFQNRILHWNRKVRKLNSRITGAFNEGITGARTTKTLVTEEQTADAFRSLTRQMHDSGIRAARLNAVFIPLVLFFGTMAVSIVLLRGGYMVLDQALELATLSAFTTYAVSIFDPIQMTAANLAEFISLQASIERVTDLMDEQPQIQDTPEVIEKYGDAFHPKRENWEPLRGEIEFRDVTFRYPDGGENVLEHFSLHIPQGTTVAIVGETGAGKSTLINLACRFFEPTEGQILIDGVDYRQRSQLWLHSNIGYVLQNPHLFSGSVRENIRYGKLDATDEEVEAAARAVSADTVVSKLENGWDSDVGEGGDRLSTGEKQLISFARAVLADPRIFVLDEATSSIDTQTEQLIQNAIDHLLTNRTSFLVAHRLSTIRKADVILVVKDGHIVEQGKHEELLRRKGYYHDLYSKQFAQESAARILGEGSAQ